MPLESVQAVDAAFERLVILEGDADGRQVGVHLGEGAQALWERWYADHAAEIAAETFPRHLRGPWAKMPAQFARLILLLHALRSDPITNWVDGETVAGAARLVAYFKAHARKVYRLLIRERRDLKVTMLRVLKMRGELRQSELLHDVFKRNVSAERLRAALDELAEAGSSRAASSASPDGPRGPCGPRCETGA